MSERHTYEVWAEGRHLCSGEPGTTRCVASFRFFLEALDYVEYCHRTGTTVLLRKPNFVGGENAAEGKWKAPKLEDCPF